ncbi:alpha-N-acetylneuraminide alpha-2,8-sialyltransferase-like [Ptychodera flava]|uniref:alpha-N-acetylneuraminide alpha-2,8-sialyltransferase-like n=1 Tax=Ptychodera flava TaxID=63121 RepID=UPI003969CDD4
MPLRQIQRTFCTCKYRGSKVAKIAALLTMALSMALVVHFYTGRMVMTNTARRSSCSNLHRDLPFIPKHCKTEVVNQLLFHNRTVDYRTEDTVLEQASMYSSHLNNTNAIRLTRINITSIVNKNAKGDNLTDFITTTDEKSSNTTLHQKRKLAVKKIPNAAFRPRRKWVKKKIVVRRKTKHAKTVQNSSLPYGIYESMKNGWQFNATAAHEFRSLLETKCCPSHLLFLTKQNIRLYTYIRYEGQLRFFAKVTPDVYNRLPEETPFKKQTFKKCSIVGNSGLVSGKGCGKSIDSTDFVIRFNLAKIRGYEQDVGNRTDLVTCNPTILRDRYSALSTNESVDQFIQHVLNEYGTVRFWLPAFSYKKCTDMSFLVQDILNRLHMDAVFPHPEHFELARVFWKTRGIDPIRISSGLMLITAAMNFCEELHVYGFWPYSQDALGKPIYYHYFDKDAIMIPDWKIEKKWHEIPDEFRILASLHNAGILHLHINDC